MGRPHRTDTSFSFSATSAQMVSPYHPSPRAALGVSNTAARLDWRRRLSGFPLSAAKFPAPLVFGREPDMRVRVPLRVSRLGSGKL